MTHQAFADEEAASVVSGEPGEVGRSGQAAFGDQCFAVRDHCGKAFGGGEVGFEGFQIAVVYAKKWRGEREGTVEFFLVMNFNQNIHIPIVYGVILKFFGLCIRDAGHDDEDAVGTPGAGFGDLIRIV